jgi:hypothetical protein
VPGTCLPRMELQVVYNVPGIAPPGPNTFTCQGGKRGINVGREDTEDCSPDKEDRFHFERTKEE